MSGKRYTPEQIIRKLREAEVLLSQGMSTPEAVRQIGVESWGCDHIPKKPSKLWCADIQT